MDLNTDYLVETIWKNLNLLRVYTKKRGEYPDFEGGLIIRSGSTIEHVVSILLLFFSELREKRRQIALDVCSCFNRCCFVSTRI